MFRNRPDAPVAWHAIAQPLVDDLHAELRAVYSLLCDATDTIAELGELALTRRTMEMAINLRIDEAADAVPIETLSGRSSDVREPPNGGA